MMKKCHEFNFHEIKVSSNEEILNSIQRNGIVSPSKLSANLLSNQTAQTSIVHLDVCVNYVNLKDASPEERKIAFEAAFDEEYLGVYGISLERTHPLQKRSNAELFMLEIQERISHQLVFILKPPSFFPLKAKPFCAKHSVDLAYYSHQRDDGFSQSRGKSLFSETDLSECSRVTEIKTNFQFSLKDIIAIMAPESIFNTCQKIFSSSNVDIISVPSCIKNLRSLPEILNKYFNEKLSESLELSVPNYAQVLNDYSCQQKLTHFSLHAVRLNTIFDFTLRPVMNWKAHEDILRLVNAQMIHQNDDGLGWFLIHKKNGHPKTKLIENSRKFLPKHIIQSFLDINRVSIENFRQLSSLKGEDEINIIYASLNAGQVHFLLKNGIQLIQTPHFYMTYSSKENAPILKQVIENFEKIQLEKAKIIQAHFRGYRCQNFFKRYKKAKEEMELNRNYLLTMVP